MKNFIWLSCVILFIEILLQQCRPDFESKSPLTGYIKSATTIQDRANYPFLVLDFDENETIKSFNIPKLDEKDSIDINPFLEYANRPFFNGVSSKYFINQIPGHIFKDNHDGTYKKISLKRFVKQNEEPKIKYVDKTYYSDRVTKQKQLNMSAKILGVSIDKESIIELVLKDEQAAYLEDTTINDALIKSLINTIDPNTLKDYYFVQGATISSVTHRIYTKQSFKGRVDYAWLTANGSTYGSRDNIKARLDVSLELTGLKDLNELYKSKKGELRK